MRLKKLVVQGFKSFADRTEFLFDTPITGIVGPNGCGKSNVVDAFKWVLGEQSAKSLRGDAMMDVIFNGAAGRKPSGMAEVVLVFENPLREDGKRALALDTEEVAVARRLYRDGGSEYHLNNSSSRLKDIRELFLDTGVGADAYSVIEQGKVSAMLEANPAERRIIFEEAAGISKFKLKKKETQRKLEKVDQNLLRVFDVVNEVDKQLRGVKIQAGKARVYQEHQSRLTEQRLALSLHEYHTHFTQSVELQKELNDTQFKLDDLAGDLASGQGQLAEQRTALDAVTQQKQRLEYELVQTNAAAQSARQKQHYADQQLKQMAEQLQGFDRDKTSLSEKLTAMTESLATETERLKTLTAELATHRQHIEQKQQAFRDGQLQLNQLNKETEQNKSAVLDLMRRLSQVNNRLGQIGIERKNVASQQSRLNDRKAVVQTEADTVSARKAELQKKLDEALANIAEQQKKLEEKRQEAAALGKQNAAVAEQVSAAREHRSGLLSRQKLLKDLETKREGVSEGVKAVLRQRDSKYPFIRGLVADVLRVDVEHAHVIEAALDGRDQWLVTDQQPAAIAAGESLADLEGRVNVVCLDRIGAPEPGDYDWNRHDQTIRFAVDLVQVDPADAAIARHLLGNTVVVPDAKTAATLANSAKGFRFVTHAGEVLEADGTLRVGPLTAAMGLLSRRSELQSVNQHVAETDERIATLTRQLTEGNTTAKQYAEQAAAQQNAVYQANTVKVELTSQIAQTNDKLNSLNREQPVLDRELGMLADQAGKHEADEQRLAGERGKFETEQAEKQKAVDDLSAKHRALADELRESNESLTTARVQLGKVQEQQLGSQQAVQRQTVSRAELAQQIERLIKSAEAIVDKRAGVEHEVATGKHAEGVAVAKAAELKDATTALATALKESTDAVNALATKVEAVRAGHTQVEKDLHRLQLEAGELTVRLETLISRATEEQELDLPAKYNAIDGGYVDPEMDWPAVAAEIKGLREKIQRLGNVNVDAINEQDTLAERQTFLATQLADLAESKRQLEELIETINVESADRFEQTFNTVREHFQGMFRKLFGGGKADVYLETELDSTPIATEGTDGQLQIPQKKKFDILDAGIEIVARPPGKQPATISQLSGGEKTMTCIALLMSIFKSKPSPFCILDEVDAALDEANNQRFNLIVQEFLTVSQFIVITHSKRTMQIADVLYGVTMQEQGVSKRVSVKFDQVDPDGRIKEPAAA